MLRWLNCLCCFARVFYFYKYFPITVPEGMRAPVIEGINSTRMGIQWKPPFDLNAPEVSYTVRRTRGSFSHPPPSVGSGIRFPGFGFYKFPPDTIPQGVSFSGIKLLMFFLIWRGHTSNLPLFPYIEPH